MKRVAAVLFALLLPGVAQASAIDKLKAFVAGTQSARAAFTQTVFDRNMRAQQQASGTMQFQRPGRFRWSYDKPYEQMIVGDAEKVWFYDKDLNQVTVKQLGEALGSTPAALLSGNNEIEKNFVLAEIGKQGELEWLEATPKAKESTFERLRLGFDRNAMLEAMELKDHFGQTTVLKFSRLERNPRLPIELFKFVPPKGADVISE